LGVFVERVDLYVFETPLRREFRIALGASTSMSSVVVSLTSGSGVVGWGEGAWAARIIGSTLGTSLEAAEHLARRLVGRDLEPGDVRRIMDRTMIGAGDSKAALETAFMDAWARELGKPLYRPLGGSRSEYRTDITIGIKGIDETIKEALEDVEQGFKTLKIKVGLDPRMDVEKIKALRDALGYDVAIRVDANQGWSPKQALYAARRLERYEVELIEQPLPYWMLRELAELRRATEIPIALDESVHTARDAARAIAIGAADVINIKLMKAGGIQEALRIAAVSEAAGVKNMIGCMEETLIGITASSHIVGAAENIVYIDLDGDLNLQKNPVEGGAAHLGGGLRRIPDEPGLGVEVDESMLRHVKTIKQGEEQKGF
jgi:L-alanine-DL-glutamate epimerase-like enolase superfamily enzyme